MKKSCNKCGEYLSLDKFYLDRGKKDGRTTICKDCKLSYVKEYKKLNPETVKQSKKKHYIKYREKYNALSTQWSKENPDKRKDISRRWKKSNKAYSCAWQSKRRAGQLKATPSWLTQEQLDYMKQLYEFRQRISGVVGREYHVDHIVPLRGENVCGLHVPWNLQVVLAKDNLSKSNSVGHLDTF